MMNRVTIYILLLLGVVWCGSVSAQNLPHRKQVRQGNKAFAEERYEKSADTYQQALKHDSTLYEARYNLGNTYIKTERWADAQEALQRALTDSTRTDRELAAAYYNLGYAQFMQDSLHQSLESFRRSLVLNSEDMNAKYNYVYVRTLLEQQQNQGGGDGDGDDQNDQNDQNNQNNQNNNQNNQNNNQNNDQNKDNQNDKQNDKQNDNQNNPDKPKDNQDDKQNDNQSDDKQNDNQNDNQSGGGDDKDEESDSQPEGGESPSGMTPEQREQMLDAIQAQEDKTQQKVDDADKKRGILIRGKKNW